MATGAVALVLVAARDAAPHNPITTTVLFNREIATLFQAKCLPCHAPGGMAMSLATYEEARPWAVAIKEEILERRMPPWPAERGFGDFANDVSLTTRERDFLVSWADGGAPKGEVEPALYLDHRAHWMLGDPDAVLVAEAGVTIEPGRAARTARIVLDTAGTRDTWVRALDYKPSDARVVRAASFTVVETGQYVGTWTPWQTTVQLPERAGIRLPARAHIAIDLLYQSSTEPVVETPRVGLYLAEAPPPRIVTTTTMEGTGGSPAGSGLRVAARHVVAQELAFFDLRPEVGPGGRSIEVKVTRPDGSSQVLLWIKDVRHDWRTSYVLREPLALPKGSVVSAIAYFNDQTQGTPRFSLTLNSVAPTPNRR